MLKNGRIDNTGRLLLTYEEIGQLDFANGDTVRVDIREDVIIISKELTGTHTYNCSKVFLSGVHIDRSILKSKMFMTPEKRFIETVIIRIYDYKGDFAQEEIIENIYYNIKYLLKDNKIIIPITYWQFCEGIRYARTVDGFGRVVIPYFMRIAHNIAQSVGVKVEFDKIIVSDDIEEKTAVNEFGMMTIPSHMLYMLDINPGDKLEIEFNNVITLTKTYF